MKVLWFVNNLCEAVEYLKPDTRPCGWLYSLCKQLRQQDNIELHVAFLLERESGSFTYNGVVYHPIRWSGKATKWSRYLLRLKGLMIKPNDSAELQSCLQIINVVSPDIIHIHGSEDMFGLITQDDSIKSPVVLSIQGLLSSCRLKYYSGIKRNDISKHEPVMTKVLLSGFNGVYRSFSERADREIVIFKTLQYVIGRTQWDKRCAISLNPNIRYFTVNEILRPEFLSSSWHVQSKEYFRLATTISSGIFKGLEVIYRTAQLLTDIHFTFEWKIIGLSANDEMVRMVEKVCRLHANDIHIDLMGSQEAAQVVDILQQSDLYIQASHIENSPNSVCEAMALGMPIIASYAGGTSSMLKNEEEGILIQDGNPYELAGAIMEAKRDYNHAVQMGKNARARALKRHNPENVVHELMEVYNTIINQTK